MNIHDLPAPPALALAALRLNLPEDAPVAAVRAAIGDHIEALIGYLDDIDDDPDLEPGADAEPSSGWPETAGQGIRAIAFRDVHLATLDGEGEPELDDEPSLGSLEKFGAGSQLDWGQGGRDDRELDLDLNEGDSDGGRETVDDEPTLGWPEKFGRRPVMSASGRAIAAFDGESEDTAPEREGSGFIRCAPDDAEDSYDAEYDHAELGIGDQAGLMEQTVAIWGSAYV